MDEQDKRPIRVKVEDKRRTAKGGSQEPPEAAAAAGAPDGVAPDADAPETMTTSPASAAEESVAEARVVEAEVVTDYLDDLRRLQADFENYRKRMLREQTALAQRASARLVEKLLPILDNLEAAVSHGEGGPGVDLVLKELKKTLADEGLSEIEADRAPFDPMLHEAFEAVEDETVDAPTCIRVLRRGYRLKDKVIRPAMVVVAHPKERSSEPDEAAEG